MRDPSQCAEQHALNCRRWAGELKDVAVAQVRDEWAAAMGADRMAQLEGLLRELRVTLWP